MNQLSNPHKSVFYAENILKGILLLALFITPLIYSSALYMPYVAGKAYLFRLLVGIALIPWVVLLFRKPDIRPNFRNPLVIALLIMLFILIITAITGVDIRRSFFSNTERSDGIIQYAYWILFFLMFISIFKTKKDWQIIFSIFIFTALINCIYGFAHFSSQPRLFGLFGNSSFLAGFLIFAIGFCLLFLFKRFKPFTEKTPIWFVFLVVALVLFFATTLFLTQTRGAYLGVLLGFIIFSVLSSIYFWRKSKRTFVVLTTILFVVLASLILVFVFRESQFIKRMPIVYRVANITHTTSVQDRLSQWSTAITAFKERPILGWGPETFDIVTNKYYDYKIGIYEPWFDRPHNQAFQYLAEGGIVLFGAYLFLVAMVFRLIFKIFKKEKILGSLLFAIYIGYIIQSLILFDAFPMFLGLFVLLALIYYLQTESSPAVVSGLPQSKNHPLFYAGIGIFSVLILIFTWLAVIIPFSGNKMIIKAYTSIACINYYNEDYNKDRVKNCEDSSEKEYKKLQSAMEEVFSVRSPYVYVDARRAIGWEFLKNVLDNKIINDNNKEIVSSLYDKFVPEIENWAKYRPADPQVYYVLGASYRIGFEKLQRQDALIKAEKILRTSLGYSPNRAEYVDELGQVLKLLGKDSELETLIQNFVVQIDPKDPYRYLSLGHFYFIQEEYGSAMEQYVKAEGLGQNFWQNNRDYYRYLQAAEQLKDYQKIKYMAEKYLKNRGEDANTLFNLAVAQLYLGDKESAKINFEKAVKLDSTFEQYRSFFQ